jgi:broad specificity phosphatase PhoE
MGTEPKYSTIYIVRHGETEHNINEIIQGQIDSPLTEKGKKQAKARAEDLKNMHFDAIFSSDLGRTVQTSQILKINRQLEINTTKLLREKFFGIYEGKPAKVFIADNQKLFEKRKHLTDAEKMQFKYEPTQESDAEAAARMITFFKGNWSNIRGQDGFGCQPRFNYAFIFKTCWFCKIR